VTLAELRAHWLSEAEHLRPFNAGASAAFEQAARELEGVVGEMERQTLTLEEAARESGYHADSLRHMIASGDLPNAGRKGAPRIARKDLPKRAGRVTSSPYDVNADAMRLVSGGRNG
jgi:hypothetical protein